MLTKLNKWMNSFLAGNPDLDSFKSEKLANHHQVYMVAGVKSRWKINLGFDRTGNTMSPKANIMRIKECIRIMWKASKTIIKAVVTDMGTSNIAF